MSLLVLHLPWQAAVQVADGVPLVDLHLQYAVISRPGKKPKQSAVENSAGALRNHCVPRRKKPLL